MRPTTASNSAPRPAIIKFAAPAQHDWTFACLQCPRGTPAAISCPAGTYSDATDLTSESGCLACPVGSWCSLGTYKPSACTAGRYGESPGLASSECTGPCAAGYHQPEEGQARCIPCAAGDHQPERGKVDCVRCRQGRDSESGSATCLLCADDYYRPNPHLPASECTLCSAIHGVSCASNATLNTLNLTVGYWRHSLSTSETHFCKFNGDWTPCLGGIDAADDGDGYCALGYRGPRCELCDSTNEYSHYFDDLDARCHDCGDVAMKVSVIVCVLLGMILAAVAAFVLSECMTRSAARARLKQRVRRARKFWRKAGMRFK